MSLGPIAKLSLLSFSGFGVLMAVAFAANATAWLAAAWFAGVAHLNSQAKWLT